LPRPVPPGIDCWLLPLPLSLGSGCLSFGKGETGELKSTVKTEEADDAGGGEKEGSG
jgi:hypothetical protein